MGHSNKIDSCYSLIHREGGLEGSPIVAILNFQMFISEPFEELYNVNIYDLFIPFSTLYMVLWVNTTHIILVENMLQMFHRVISRGPLSLFQLEFVSLSR